MDKDKKQETKAEQKQETKQPEQETKMETKTSVEDAQTTVQIFGLFIFVWTVMGLIAFVWSIYCFGKKGTIFQKILGILMAMFLGPLFFFYYRYSPTYCK
jgi:H+/gluconate symporter-like permease